MTRDPDLWHAYFTIHAEGWIVADPERPAATKIAEVSTAPDDYGRANTLTLALGAALVRWMDTTHGNEFGHDHHCPLPGRPWPTSQLDGPADDRCSCGWSDVIRAEAARQAATP